MFASEIILQSSSVVPAVCPVTRTYPGPAPSRSTSAGFVASHVSYSHLRTMSCQDTLDRYGGTEKLTHACCDATPFENT